MVNFLLVSHGDFADGILSAMHLIVGQQEGVIAISLKETDSIDDLEARIDAAIEELIASGNVLLLVDLLGASPFNTSAKLIEKYPNLQIVTGMNLPMLLEIVVQREDQTVEELAKLASEVGRNGIRTLQELMDQSARA